jgi:hypothetical protein
MKMEGTLVRERKNENQRQSHDAKPIGSIMLLTLAFFSIAEHARAACNTSICGTSPCTISGNHTIDSGCVLDFGTKDVILTGTLNGDNNAACYTILANSLTVRGTLRARSSCINVDVDGNFKTEVVSSSAALVDVRNANSTGDGVFITCGSATLEGNDINADADNSQVVPYFPAGDIVITCTGDILGDGGPFHANASGGDDGGDITITSSGGEIDLASAFEVHGGGDFSFGGDITITASGDATVGDSGQNLLAYSAQGGFAGSVDIAAGGAATVDGAINVNGNGDTSDGGEIAVSGASVSTGTVWQVRGDEGGSGGAITIDATNGGITTASSASFYATGGSGGGSGGAIELTATGSITLAGDMDVAGNGEDSSAGSITIIGAEGCSDTITVASTSHLEADGSGTNATDGTIEVEGWNISVSGVLDSRNSGLVDGSGINALTYGGTLTTAGGSSLLADDTADGGANEIYCRCVDTSPADGTCDSPAACVSNPSLSGTVTPAQTLIPFPIANINNCS